MQIDWYCVDESQQVNVTAEKDGASINGPVAAVVAAGGLARAAAAVGGVQEGQPPVVIVRQGGRMSSFISATRGATAKV